jgi:DNA-binding NtrC family response regulator
MTTQMMMPDIRHGDPAATTPLAALIVEPDATIAELLALYLGEEGHAAEPVTSPDDALAVLAARGPEAFDVILSAPCAPLERPYAWLDRLRARTRAPIAICTRHPAWRYADYHVRGFAAVIEEPCEVQVILEMIARIRAGG